MQNAPYGKCSDMRRIWTVLVLGALALLMSGAVAVAKTTAAATNGDDGQGSVRDPGACEQWSVVASCGVSWYRLQANPSAYRGKIVGLTGYLVSDFGDLILYPDKANYEGGNELDSIVLERPFAVSQEIVDKAVSGVYPVFVLGRLGPPVQGNVHVVPRAGSLYDIHKIIITQRVPSGSPLNKKGIRIQPSEG
ncbi:hypothetical protein SAMN05192579_12017 [Rhodanobacter glycinis]|uniref:Uncharacterized protein n=2 Tax=Rhodanobacteraceae TaxID=1775411 RepID=A0A1I4FWH5_9GAMM|nr:hypothetical protein SAMN05192579_12017 [Rhodanobacter glycinis]